MKYQVWLEGYRATCEDQPAEFLGEYEADTFEQACYNACLEKGLSMDSYDSHRNSYWARNFYDNETDARKFNG